MAIRSVSTISLIPSLTARVVSTGITVFVYRVEGLVKSGDFDKAVDKSREFRYLKLDEWERVQRICQS